VGSGEWARKLNVPHSFEKGYNFSIVAPNPKINEGNSILVDHLLYGVGAIALRIHGENESDRTTRASIQ
jgi:hypothetical protein